MNRDDTRTYESVVILRPSLADPDIRQFTELYTARLEQAGSAMLKVDNWGKRKLAYEVKGERKGTYLCFCFRGKGNVIQPLESANRIDDMILKSMVIRIENGPKSTVPHDEVKERESGIV